MYKKEELKKLKMSELREIGKKFGASDTSKSELIEEILLKQTPGKVGELLKKLERFEGDLVETYSLRDEIIENLKRLQSYEIKEG